MRYVLVITAIVVSAAPAFAQTSNRYPYGLDPYKPSDAQFLREWGDVLVQQTPLAELAGLDPYTPSEAALRRRIGGGQPLPVTGFLYYPSTNDRTPLRPSVERTPLAPPAAAVAPPAAVTAPAAIEVSTIQRPENNDGIWIRFAGEKYVSAGPAVAFDAATYARAGDYAGFDVYRRRGGSDDLIFVPTRDGLVAPYRRK